MVDQRPATHHLGRRADQPVENRRVRQRRAPAGHLDVGPTQRVPAVGPQTPRQGHARHLAAHVLHGAARRPVGRHLRHQDVGERKRRLERGIAVEVPVAVQRPKPVQHGRELLQAVVARRVRRPLEAP